MADINELVKLSMDEVKISPTSVDNYNPVTLITVRGEIDGRYYKALNATKAVVWVGGVGGGFDNPAHNLYHVLAQELAKEGISSLRIQYRYPSDLQESVLDVVTGMHFLMLDGIDHMGLVGHSMGGAVAIQAALASEKVKTIVTLATQTYGAADGVEKLKADTSILLLHGVKDEVLPPACSSEVFSLANKPKEIILYEGAGHNLDEVADDVKQKVKEWLRKRLL